MKPGPVRLHNLSPLRRRQSEIVAGLRAERQRRGLSQRAVSLLLGRSESTVGQWENPSRPAYERHRRRREACGVCTEWFTARRRNLKSRAA